jgi:hypothetical protein
MVQQMEAVEQAVVSHEKLTQLVQQVDDLAEDRIQRNKRISVLEAAIREVGTDCRLYPEEARCSTVWPAGDDPFGGMWCGGYILHVALTQEGNSREAT